MVRKLESYMFIADGTLINVFSTAYTSITLPELTNSSFITCVIYIMMDWVFKSRVLGFGSGLK